MAQNYLVLNQSGYYFRIIVPADLRNMIGLREIKRSLKTGVLGLAKEKARLLAGKIQRLYRALREDKMGKLTPEKIQELVNIHIKETLEWIENEPLTRERPTTLEAAHAHAEIMSDMAIELKKALVKGDFYEVSHIADRLLREDGQKAISKDSMDYKRLCREILKAAIELTKIDAARTLGDYSVQYPRQEKPLKMQTAEKDDSIRLKDLINIHMKENIRAEAWSQSTINDYNTISKVMMRFIGTDTPISSISHETMRDYKEVLQCLPPRFISLSKYDGMNAADVKALNLPPEKTISVKSINKNFTYIISLFNYAVSNGYMDTNPAQGLKLKEKAVLKDSVAPFSPEDLERIFTDSGFGKNHPYQLWVPLLALYTGCRREELCQLYVSDLKKTGEGVWYLDINKDTPDKTLKNPSSKRLVPLHSFICDEMKFPEFVASIGHQRIFPELKRTKAGKKYGHYFGKWFNGLVEKLGIKDPDKPSKTFHSFRHGLITQLTHAGVDSGMLKQMVGHAEKGVTFNVYFKGYTVEQLYHKVISKLDYGLDLGHLKKSKWITPDPN